MGLSVTWDFMDWMQEHVSLPPSTHCGCDSLTIERLPPLSTSLLHIWHQPSEGMNMHSTPDSTPGSDRVIFASRGCLLIMLNHLIVSCFGTHDYSLLTGIKPSFLTAEMASCENIVSPGLGPSGVSRICLQGLAVAGLARLPLYGMLIGLWLQFGASGPLVLTEQVFSTRSFCHVTDLDRQKE